MLDGELTIAKGSSTDGGQSCCLTASAQPEICIYVMVFDAFGIKDGRSNHQNNKCNEQCDRNCVNMLFKIQKRKLPTNHNSLDYNIN